MLELDLIQILSCIFSLKKVQKMDSLSKANSKYFKSYDPKPESKHIYLDTNNLCGYATSK